jgi:hypothetical protein
MDQRPDQNPDKSAGDNAAAGKGSEGAGHGDASAGAEQHAAQNDLPSVQAPSLAGGDGVAECNENSGQGDSDDSYVGAVPALFGEYFEEEPSETTPAADPQPRSFRCALLAATIACAAGIGALVGSLSATKFAHHSIAAAPAPKVADARDIVQALKAQVAELSSLKTELDGANRSASAQFAKIADRLNTLERAQTEPTAKLAHIADTLDRLNKRAAASPDITGSIAANPAAIPATPADANLPILHNWEVNEVHAGRALVVSRYGTGFLVGPGSSLPGLGHVQEVKRQNGGWVVVTDKGVITAHP